MITAFLSLRMLSNILLSQQRNLGYKQQLTIKNTALDQDSASMFINNVIEKKSKIEARLIISLYSFSRTKFSKLQNTSKLTIYI